MELNKKLVVSSSPHIRDRVNTRSIMLDVIIALIPAMIVAICVFGFQALALTVISVAACIFFEWLYRAILHKDNTIGDLSAVVTGILMAFCMPANAPLWLPIPGACFAMIVVKQLFGGLGKNFINPALGARAFLNSWPVLMTTFAAPFCYKVMGASIMNIGADVVTAATPMASLHAGALPDASLSDMFLGFIGGSLGEVSALALIIGGVYLCLRKVITPRIPVAYIATVAVLTFIFPKGDAGHLEWMLYNLLGGGLMLGAIFMATDYVTSPITKKGQVIYGIGCGLITVFIRYFGSYPEGVSYSILVMNVCAWLIDKMTPPRQFGVSAEEAKAAKAKAKAAKKEAKV